MNFIMLNKLCRNKKFNSLGQGFPKSLEPLGHGLSQVHIL